MFCANCGTKQNDGEKFCPNCGTKFEEPLKVEVSKVEEVSRSEASKLENIVLEKMKDMVLIEVQTTEEEKIVLPSKEELVSTSTIKHQKEKEVKNGICEPTTKFDNETVVPNKQYDKSLDNNDVVLWNKLNIIPNLNNSSLLQELDFTKRSGVISDKYKFESKIIFDSKTLHQKMKSEEYDEVDSGGSLLRFKFYIDSNFKFSESTFIYDGKEDCYSCLDSYISYFNSEVGKEYNNDYYLKIDKDSWLVEGLFTKEHKGFWGFMKIVPNADKLEIKFKEIYSICKKIKLL